MDEDIEYIIDEKDNNFIILIRDGFQVLKIEPSKFYKKSKFQINGSYMEQNNVKYDSISDFDICLSVREKHIKLFCNPLKITNASNEKTIIYSKDHFLTLINHYPDKFKYYKTVNDDNWKKFKIDKIDDIIMKLNKIIFLDKNIMLEESESFFKDMKEKYDDFFKTYKTVFLIDKINPILISVNFLKYYPTTKDEPINVIQNDDRSLYIMSIKKFYKNEEKVKAYTGPYGIGKTFTFLMAQKSLYINGIRSLYINLKYYETLASLDEKIETLQKECFYLFFEEDEYSSFLKNTIIFPFNSVFEAIFNIVTYLNLNNNTYLIILDQFQEKFFSNEELKSLKDICKKLVLISSINDTDVKLNIKKMLSKEHKSEDYIEYEYIFKLITNLENNKYNNYQEKIMNYFGNLPIYEYKIEFLYENNFLEFYENELKKIFLKIENFFKNRNKSFLKDLLNKKQINSIYSGGIIYIELKNFLEIIDNIPLKYINFIEKGKQVALYFAFPLIEEILNKYFEYNNNIINFNKIEGNEGKLGTVFEEIVSVDFKIRSLMEIYSFFDVSEILNLNEPNDNFVNLKELYLSKKRIFIGQTNFRGPKYDMGVILTEEKTLILIQAKYKITDKILSKTDYKKEVKKMLVNIKNLGFNIDTIHILYFSSIDYNRNESVYNILENKDVECYFYSIHKKKFYKDIYEIYPIDDFILSDKTKLCGNYVNWKVNYNPPKYIPLNDIVQENINLLEKRFFKQITENKYDDNNLVNLHKSFLDYLNNNNLCMNFIKKLGMFLILSPQEYPNGIYRFNNIDYYILVCKITEFKIIFNENIYIIFHDDNSKINYYNVNNDIRVKKSDFIKDIQSEKFNYIQGYWKNE